MAPIIIFFENTPVYLSDDLIPYKEDLLAEDTLLINKFTNRWLDEFLQKQEWENYSKVIVLGENISNLKKKFFGNFKIIKAGGGLVLNEKGELLLIFRRGKWDLPKGKLEEGEAIDECALREVQEETGLKKVSLSKPLGSTFHTYYERNKWILKESIWFQMMTNSEEQLIPQQEEDITEIKWVSLDQVKNYEQNMYPALIPLIKGL
jgi:8-oxo-dGTP pyrophosphatase MutT (NUDIX family)